MGIELTKTYNFGKMKQRFLGDISRFSRDIIPSDFV